jgi:hypothetical protein
MDRISTLSFNSDMLAKSIFHSQLTSLVHKTVGVFRTPEDKEIASQLAKQKQFGLY